MIKPRLSICVTLHDENETLHATAQNIKDMLEPLRKENIACELLLHLDRTSEPTRKIAEALKNDEALAPILQIFSNDFGDPSLSRNFLIAQAKGEFLALLDGDDLCSKDWLYEGYHMLSKLQDDTILHPEFLLNFGDSTKPLTLWKMRDCGSSINDWQILFGFNLWCARMIGKTETFKKFPMKANGKKFGFEDWLFNIESRMGGVRHLVVPNSVVLYRNRPDSVFAKHNKEQVALRKPEAYSLENSLKVAKRIAGQKIDQPANNRIARYSRSLYRKAMSITTPSRQLCLKASAKHKLAKLPNCVQETIHYAKSFEEDLNYTNAQLESLSLYEAKYRYMGQAYCQITKAIADGDQRSSEKIINSLHVRLSDEERQLLAQRTDNWLRIDK